MNSTEVLGHGFPMGITTIGIIKVVSDACFGKGSSHKVNQSDSAEEIKLGPGLEQTLYLVEIDTTGVAVIAPGKAVTFYSWSALDRAEVWYW